MSVLIKGGEIVTSTGRYVADVFAAEDKIKSIGVDLDTTNPFVARRRILQCPGRGSPD